MRTGVLITPFFVRHWETEGTIAAGHIGAHVHSDWSWANVEMLAGYVAEGDVRGPDGAALDVDATPVWTTYLTSCMEEGFPALYSRNGWKHELFTGFGPEASDSPVWAWPGVLTNGPDQPVLEDVAPPSWPQWTWRNHPDITLPKASRGSKLPPADCAGIAAGRYTPDYIHPLANAGNYPNWMSALGARPPESWSVTESPFDE
ncbi:MAG: hypothetical protein F4Y40_08170 [Acidimicrobiia bacterium]|nr:hypothetical protein [Acidimicrobiia bacterium]MYF83846.1 hypothetical protein [Acidimicrobiia bacterium]